MSRGALVLLLAALLPLPLAAQQLVTFTESQGGDSNRPLGYPVPIPVASLEAVDGFRDYASLEARLQALALASEDLSAHPVGTTQGHGRTVWAYRVGDADSTDNEGGAEAAFFINAGIHAREWGTQEISTWLVERMMAGAGDGAIVRWLLDTTTLVIVPVHNVDGFLQTQRFPTQALVGADPRFPDEWPRDGRMRRKNMRGVDELLQSTNDHLGGIDLNRNHPPYWATSAPGYSSADPDDLVYHGSGPHSESESLALVQALLLAPPERLRIGVDVHSFGQVFFSSNTGRDRLNAIQSLLLARVSAHHHAVATPAGALTGLTYPESRDPPGVGGGLVAEYLAHDHLVPAWTLEIEPNGQRGGLQYGGTSEGHAGFILPASEVRRVREGWAESHLAAFYYMAGAPYLAEVRILDAASGVLVARQRWQRVDTARVRAADAANPLQPGRRYRAELVFSKPMRVSVGGAAPSGMPGQFVSATPSLMLVGPGQQIGLGAGEGSWLAQGARYAYDTFALEFDAPAAPGSYSLRVDTTDAVGHRLDANPATPVDWVQGAWSGLENAEGVAGDVGGADAGTQFTVQDHELLVRTFPSVLGEGDLGRIVLERIGGAGAIEARASLPPGETSSLCPSTTVSSASWAAGETGTRTLTFCLGDDLLAQGDRSLSLSIEASRDGLDFSQLLAGTVVVQDNDLAGAPVLRVAQGSLSAALQVAGLATPEQSVELVLDGGEQVLDVGPTLQCNHNGLFGPATVHGNHAVIRHAAGAGDCTLLAIGGTEPVELRDLTLTARGPDGGASAQLLTAVGAPLVLRSVVLQGGRPSPGAAASGSMLHVPLPTSVTLARTALRDLDRDSTSAASLAGTFAIASSSLAALDADALLHLDGATGSITGSTVLVSDGGDLAVAAGEGSAVVLSGNMLQHAPDGTLCAGDGAFESAGGNVASDGTCGLGAGDPSPRTLQLEAEDALTGAPLPPDDAVDVGGSCPTVDLRGAPRPQSMDGDAVPLCDAGAIELGINPYRGLWIPERSGHGVDIHTVGNTLFLTWYTYHPDGSPAAYQAAAQLTGPVWRAPLASARRLPDGSIERFETGEVELAFASDTEATLRWRIGDAAEWGEEGLSAYLFAEGEPRVEATGTWYDPADSGWGITVTRRGGITGLVLYYYDAAGELRWALAQGGDGDVLSLPLFGYTGFCPDCDAEANPATASPAGTLQVQFLTPVRARAWVDAGTGGGQRFQRQAAPLVPLNDPVDNRRAAAAAAAQSAGASSDGSR